MKKLKKVFAVIVCVFVLFSALCAPFSVSAVVGIDDAICYFLATCALSLGGSVATGNLNAGDIVNYGQQMYNSIDPFTRSIIEEGIKSRVVPLGLGTSFYSYYCEWSTSQWEQIGNAIIGYYEDVVPDYEYQTVTPSASGKIGFTSDSIFTISQDVTAVKNTVYMADLGKSFLYYGQFDRSVLSSMFPALGIPATDTQNPFYYAAIYNDDGFGQILCLNGTNNIMYPQGDFISQSSSVSDSTSTTSYNVALKDGAKYIRLFLSPQNTTYTTKYIQWTDGTNYYDLTTVSGSGRWGFVSTTDGSVYQNADFTSYHRAICWFAESCGIQMPNSSYIADDYVAHPTDSFISLDTDTAADILSDQIASAEDDTISMVVAGNPDDLAVLADEPALILDPTAAANSIVIYPTDLPAIDASGTFWTTKFPFCLPWDIYHLVVDFAAPEQAPVLHFLVFPAGAFGVSMSDTYIDIDFEDYYDAVQIFRFFVKIEIVLGIILITKRLIK